MALTTKQELFVDYYIKTGNATQSYIDAGYKATTRKVADANARKLLAKDSIIEYLKERNKQVDTEAIASLQEVKEFWTRVMRDENEFAKERLKASEYIAKVNGAFIDKVEHSGKVESVHNLSKLSAEELRSLAAQYKPR
jgi:phage terminase small subunit